MDVNPGSETPIFHIAATKHSFKIGEREYNLADYPPQSVDHIIAKGLAGLYVNEVASYVSEAKKKAQDGGNPLTEADIAQIKAEQTAKQHNRLVKGDFSGIRGPRGSKVETLMAAYAVAEITARLRVANLSMPNKKDETVKFPDGSQLSRTQLIERMLAKKGDVFRIKAEKEMARLDDEAKRVSAKTDGGGIKGVEDLGF